MQRAYLLCPTVQQRKAKGQRAMINRRTFLKKFGLVMAGGMALGGYGFGIEPFRLRVKRHEVSLDRWPAGHRTRIAALADIHACQPWMSIRRIQSIVTQTNALNPDITVLLGDYSAGHPWVTGGVHSRHWSKALSGLSAPLGVHAVMGNHDWWEDKTAQRRGSGPVFGQLALEKAGIAVYENDVSAINHKGHRFWLAGLGDQLALIRRTTTGRKVFRGVDDLTRTLAKTGDDAPVLLLAHEPDVFPKVPDQVCLTLSGHTHGGQVALPRAHHVNVSRMISDHTRGVFERDDATMYVNRGLGMAGLPLRLNCPREIALIELV